jgi:hypothetical protein
VAQQLRRDGEIGVTALCRELTAHTANYSSSVISIPRATLRQTDSTPDREQVRVLDRPLGSTGLLEA